MTRLRRGGIINSHLIANVKFLGVREII